MKYSEFAKEVKELGLHTVITDDICRVVGENDLKVAYVSTDTEFKLGNGFWAFDNLPREKQAKLAKLAWELASTPLDLRKDVDHYYLHVLDSNFEFTKWSYVLQGLNNGEIVRSSKPINWEIDINAFQMAFTLDEIEQIRKDKCVKKEVWDAITRPEKVEN